MASSEEDMASKTSSSWCRLATVVRFVHLPGGSLAFHGLDELPDEVRGRSKVMSQKDLTQII